MTEQTIAEIGEFELIGQIAHRVPLPPQVSVGPGDDAAVFLTNGSVVTSVDMMVEGVDFRRDWSSPQDVGHKAVAINLSDLEAMGATPVGMVIAFGAPADLPVSWVRGFMTGVNEEAEAAGVALLGGDLSSARDITVTVTVFGGLDGRSPVLRSTARIGDQVCLCGRLGWASAGLEALGRGFRSPRAAVDAHRRPLIPHGQGRIASLAGATAMIDISDGLIADLGHVAKASGVGIQIDPNLLVVDEPVATVARATNSDPLRHVLAGGEDYALVATFPVGIVPEFWRVIGQVVAPDPEEGPAVSVHGRSLDDLDGWTHFRR
ncbi:thiamine-monophosphate kinase [Propionibacterium sp. oral taxon 192 str. F0372]|uniref:thiamine-phosphate kinase n=1 Tax=Propionibacterium sp. oral taxon 192 TaxID=671222 RepID=UPI00035304B7|nr:thiamine-phosphate kinase [Propionibacterium sp. oral taxon 192]EPH02930.1 thiamine-monophosphate kinase [Propionibacterium sp. oral taxon 192 str. F0372]